MPKQKRKTRSICRTITIMWLLMLSTFVVELWVAGSAIRNIPRNYNVEGASGYFLMPGVDGNLHLVDNHAPVDHAFLANRNGANNKYWLYTRQNQNTHQDLYLNDVNSVSKSNYVASRPLVVIVHGWQHDGTAPVCEEVKEAVLMQSDANVLILDWSDVAMNPDYFTSAAGVPNVGEYLGDFLVWLINNNGGNWNNVHLIGHSLGAHVVGNAGRRTGSKPARITGLDAANPAWNNNAQAINKNDGQYVEAIHTDGNLQGLFAPYGDADFYPNGGTYPQPGCASYIVDTSCSHARAYEYFASSVRTNHFVGTGCTNEFEANLGTCTGPKFNMGNNILTKRGSGIYYLKTGSSWPF